MRAEGDSLDGGATYCPARQGVRILYPDTPLPGDGQSGYLSVNVTSEGLILDVWISPDTSTSQRIGNEAATVDEIIGRLTQ